MLLSDALIHSLPFPLSVSLSMAKLKYTFWTVSVAGYLFSCKLGWHNIK